MRKLWLVFAIIMMVMVANQVFAGSVNWSTMTQAERLAILQDSDNHIVAQAKMRAGGVGADEVRLTTDGYQSYNANAIDINWQDDALYTYVLELNNASTLSLTITGDSVNETVTIPVTEWVNTILISLNNNSIALTKLQSVNNTANGNIVGDLNATYSPYFAGIAITFSDNYEGNMNPIICQGTFSTVGTVSLDDWNLQFDLMQVPPTTNTPPASPTASTITTGNNMVNINWSADTNGSWYVESKTDLTATNWTEIAGPLVNPGGTVSYSNTISVPVRFFRLINK